MRKKDKKCEGLTGGPSVDVLIGEGAARIPVVPQGLAAGGFSHDKVLSLGQWEVVFNSITDMVSIHDNEFRIIKANKAFIDTLGLDGASLIGRKCHEVIHHTGEPWLNCPHRASVEGNVPVTEEFLEPRLMRHLQVSASPVINEAGEVIGSVHIVKDVTDRKRGEEALRQAHDELGRRVEERTAQLRESLDELKVRRKELEAQNEKLTRYQSELEQSRALYEDLYDYAPVGYFTFDRKGIILRANLRGANLLGSERDILVGDAFEHHVAPEYADILREHFRQVFEDKGKKKCELGLRQTNGTALHVAMESTTVKDVDGSATRMRSILSDVTERWKAEEKLKESEQRFRMLFEGHHAVMLLVEPETGAIIDANEAAADFYGYPRSLLSTMNIDEINQTDRDEIAAQRVTAAEEKRNYFIFPHRLADGDIRTVEVHSSPIEVRGRRLLFSIIHDITERRRAEEKLKESELALRISQRDLRKLAGRLLSAEEEERRRVARELHDDFTQRLAVLAINAGKLEQDLAVKCPEVVPAVEKVKDQVVQLSGDVHRLARQLHPSILDDLGLVKAMESECARFSRQEEMPVKLATRDVPEPIAKETAIALYRIMQEALRNVAKHAQAKEARVTLSMAGDALRLTIADNGVGFDPKPPKGRAGMGLASMRERVRLLRGKFSVESLPGEGAIIAAEVPLKRRKP